MFSGQPAQTIRRSGQRNAHVLSRHAVFDLGGITGSVDVRIAGALEFVHDDRAALADRQPRFHCEPHVRPHADRQQYQIRFDDSPIFKFDASDLAIVVGLERLEPHASYELHVVPRQLIGDIGGHFRIQRRQRVRRLFNDRHIHSAPAHRLGHLQADESGADDDGAAGRVRLEVFVHRDRVFHRAEKEQVRGCNVFDGRHDRFGAGREDQLVVRDPLDLLRLSIAHLHEPFDAVDPQDFVPDCARRG